MLTDFNFLFCQVIVEKAPKARIGDLDKKKYLVPSDLTGRNLTQDQNLLPVGVPLGRGQAPSTSRSSEGVYDFCEFLAPYIFGSWSVLLLDPEANSSPS